jgi:O-acetyl-ADP-ribose deacetylase
MREVRLGDAVLSLLNGDITSQHVDAIVNAANSTLMGGGGVDGAIHRRGGPAILEDCKRIRREKFPNGLPTGKAVSTTAGTLPAQRVIHTVGPIWSGGENREPEQLANAYHNSLMCASDEGLRSVAFPSISTGAYGYPKREAAHVALATIIDFLKDNKTVREVRIVLFSEGDLRIFEDALTGIEHFPRGNT